MIYSELIAPNNFKRMPWKNGQGETTELCVKSDTVTNKLVWRLSIASVAEDGDFSNFSGFQRTLMLVSGNGLELSHGGQATQYLTRQYEYCIFNGSWQTSAKLIDGPITNFNIICDSSRASVKVSILKVGESKEVDSYANDIFFFANKGAGSCSPSNCKISKELEIPKGYLLHTSNSDTTRMTVAGDGLICVEIYN